MSREHAGPGGGRLGTAPILVRMARGRLAAMVAIVLAVAGGAALITPMLMLLHWGLFSHPPVGPVERADVVISGSQSPTGGSLETTYPQRTGVDPALAGTLADRTGIDAAAARIGVHVVPLGPTGDPHVLPDPGETGANWSFAALGDPAVTGEPPRTGEEVALSADLAAELGAAPGESVQLLVAGEQGRFAVTAVVDAPGSTVSFADDIARQLAGDPPRADLIGLSLDDPTTASQTAAALAGDPDAEGYEITTGDARGDAAAPGAAAERGMAVLLAASGGGTLLLTVGAVVGAAVAMSSTQQRREIALLRATGATPSQVRGLISAQSTLAALIGLPAGIAVGYGAMELFGAGTGGDGQIPPPRVLAAVASAGLTAVLLLVVVGVAARIASGRLSRLAPTAALGRSALEPRPTSPLRTAIGAVLIAPLLVTSLVPLFTRSEAALISASSTVLVGCIGAILVLPAVIRRLSAAHAARTASRTDGGAVPGWLAAHSSYAYAGRTAGAAGILAMAVALAITQVFLTTTPAAAVAAERTAADLSSAQVTGPETGGLPEAARAELAGTDGVDHAVGTIDTTVMMPYRFLDEEGVEARQATAFSSDPSAVVDLAVTSGDLERLDESGTVALSTRAARDRGASLGESVDLTSDDGRPMSLELIATFDRGIGYGDVVLGTDTLGGGHPGRLYDTVLVDGSPGAVAAWAGSRPGAETTAAGDVASDPAAGGTGGISGPAGMSLLLTLGLLAHVVMAGATMLVATTTRRRTELTLLRRLGATPRQLRAMLRREAALVCGLAAGVGLALSVPAMTLLGWGTAGQVRPQGPLWVIPLMVAIVVAVAGPSVMIPARRILRGDPAGARADG